MPPAGMPSISRLAVHEMFYNASQTDWRTAYVSPAFPQSDLTNLQIRSVAQSQAVRSGFQNALDARGLSAAAPAAESPSAPLAAPCVCYQAKEPEPFSTVLSRAGKRCAICPPAQSAVRPLFAAHGCSVSTGLVEGGFLNLVP